MVPAHFPATWSMPVIGAPLAEGKEAQPARMVSVTKRSAQPRQQHRRMCPCHVIRMCPPFLAPPPLRCIADPPVVFRHCVFVTTVGGEWLPCTRVFGKNPKAGLESVPLFLERADIVHDLPALGLGKLLPGGHGPPTIRDLPEQLTVRVPLDCRRRPINRLGLQRGRGDPVAATARTVAGRAVGCDYVLCVPDAFDRILQRLGLGGSLPIALGPGRSWGDQHGRREYRCEGN